MIRRIQTARYNRRRRKIYQHKKQQQRLKKVQPPDEIWSRVYQLLSNPIDQHAFRCTCKQYHRVASKEHANGIFPPITLSALVTAGSDLQRDWAMTVLSSTETVKHQLTQSIMNVSLAMLQAKQTFEKREKRIFSIQPGDTTTTVKYFDTTAWDTFRKNDTYRLFQHTKEWAKGRGAIITTTFTPTFGKVFIMNSDATNACIETLWWHYGLLKSKQACRKPIMRITRHGDFITDWEVVYNSSPINL